MIKLFLGIMVSLGVVHSSYANSNTNMCPTVAPQYNVKVQSSNIIYNYDYYSRDLSSLGKQNGMQVPPDMIGLFKGNLNITSQPSVKTSTVKLHNKTYYCSKVSQMNIIIEFAPVIHIAKEVLGLPCITRMTALHEYNHYTIEFQALQNLRQNIGPLLKDKFNSYSYANSIPEAEQILNNKNQEFLNTFLSLFRQNTVYQHARFDTPENYSKEAQSCSEAENKELFNRLYPNL